VLCGTFVVSERQPRQAPDDLVRVIPHVEITADKVGVIIEEGCASTVQQPAVVQVEKDRSTSDERLYVLSEHRWVELTDATQELPLAAHPFQKRTRLFNCSVAQRSL